MSLTSCVNAPRALNAPSWLLIEEITHRVLNEYSTAICALDEAATAVGPRFAGPITAATTRLMACAEAHRALQAPIGDGPRDLADHLSWICSRLANAELDPRGIRLLVSAESVRLTSEQCWYVGLIVAELVRNAMRHGLGGRPGEIRLDVAERFGRVCCAVRDDGRPSSDQGVGRGLRIVEAMAERLGGAVAWAFTPLGCCARLEFPAAPAEARERSGAQNHAPHVELV